MPYSDSSPTHFQQVNPPKELCCPITQKLIKKAVKAADGVTYEEEAIRVFFNSRIASLSTVANKPFAHHELEPDLEMQRKIDDYLQQQQSFKYLSQLRANILNHTNPEYLITLVTNVNENNISAINPDETKNNSNENTINPHIQQQDAQSSQINRTNKPPVQIEPIDRNELHHLAESEKQYQEHISNDTIVISSAKPSQNIPLLHFNDPDIANGISIPPDIFRLIFLLLSKQKIRSLELVCHLFRYAINDDLYWRDVLNFDQCLATILELQKEGWLNRQIWARFPLLRINDKTRNNDAAQSIKENNFLLKLRKERDLPLIIIQQHIYAFDHRWIGGYYEKSFFIATMKNTYAQLSMLYRNSLQRILPKLFFHLRNMLDGFMLMSDIESDERNISYKEYKPNKNFKYDTCLRLSRLLDKTFQAPEMFHEIFDAKYDLEIVFHEIKSLPMHLRYIHMNCLERHGFSYAHYFMLLMSKANLTLNDTFRNLPLYFAIMEKVLEFGFEHMTVFMSHIKKTKLRSGTINQYHSLILLCLDSLATNGPENTHKVLAYLCAHSRDVLPRDKFALVLSKISDSPDKAIRLFKKLYRETKGRSFTTEVEVSQQLKSNLNGQRFLKMVLIKQIDIKLLYVSNSNGIENVLFKLHRLFASHLPSPENILWRSKINHCFKKARILYGTNDVEKLQMVLAELFFRYQLYDGINSPSTAPWSYLINLCAYITSFGYSNLQNDLNVIKCTTTQKIIDKSNKSAEYKFGQNNSALSTLGLFSFVRSYKPINAENNKSGANILNSEERKHLLSIQALLLEEYTKENIEAVKKLFADNSQHDDYNKILPLKTLKQAKLYFVNQLVSLFTKYDAEIELEEKPSRQSIIELAQKNTDEKFWPASFDVRAGTFSKVANLIEKLIRNDTRSLNNDLNSRPMRTI